MVPSCVFPGLLERLGLRRKDPFREENAFLSCSLVLSSLVLYGHILGDSWFLMYTASFLPSSLEEAPIGPRHVRYHVFSSLQCLAMAFSVYDPSLLLKSPRLSPGICATIGVLLPRCFQVYNAVQ